MKFYKNKATKYHPSLEVSNDEKTWKNMFLTHHPTKTGRYIKLKNNPNPKDHSDSYIEKHLRNDPIRTRGQLLKKYRLTEEDLQQIEDFLRRNKKS